MAMKTGFTKSTVAISGEKVKGTNIFVPQRLEKTGTLLIEGIRGYKQLGPYGSFGILLKGIAGTGKSVFTRYIADEKQTGAMFFRAPMLTDPEEVRHLFESARAGVKDGPVMILLDDFDYVGKRSESANPAFRPVLAQVLSEMDAPGKNLGVFTFITSNLPDMLDEALRRPPRVTYEIEFLPPTRIEREKMLDAILSDPSIRSKWSHDMVVHTAKTTFGYTPADLLGVVQNAMMQAIVARSETITIEHVDAAKKMQKPSAIRDMPFIEPTEKLDSLAGGYIEAQKGMLAELAVRIDNGVLGILYGPSGCGKTALAKAVAANFGFNCLYFNPSHIVDKYVGESGKALTRAFSRARALSPCILILDQAEGILNPENQYSKEWTSVLKSELSDPMPGVFVMMTGTDPSNWGDEVLTRFHKIYIPRPDARSQMEVLRKLIPEKDSKNVDIGEVLHASNGTLTPREIGTAIKSIHDFGYTLTTSSLVKVIGAQKRQIDEAYEREIAERVGDATATFRALKG